MRKLTLLLVLFSFIACKKKSPIADDNDIISKNWVLETATVNPAINVNGTLITDYKNLEGPNACLAYNFTLLFSKDGTYTKRSDGTMCRTLYSKENWTRTGSSILLNSNTDKPIKATLDGNKITYTIVDEGFNYRAYTYIFIAK